MENKIILIDHGDGSDILSKLKAAGMDTTSVILVKPEDMKSFLPNISVEPPKPFVIQKLESLVEPYVSPEGGRAKRRKRREQERKN